MKKSTRLLLWISALGFMLFLVSMVAVVLLVSYEGGLPGGEPRTLVFELEGEIPDGPIQGAFILDEADFPPLLTELSQAIRKAADDEQVSDLYLHIRPVSIGLAGVQELAAALQDFRASGKPCRAHADTLTNKEYMLAAACGEVQLAPAGLILVNGLSMQHSYYSETLEMIGVTPNFEHVGDFKSAVEPFERTGPSEAAELATNTLLDSLYEQFVALIAQGRGLEQDQVRALVDDPPFTPAQALEEGMIDGLSYAEEMLDHDQEVIEEKDYIRDLRRDNRRGPLIAVIHAEGNIVSGEGGAGMFGGTFAGDESVVALLEEAQDDDEVVAVVLRVNSPGGSGLASDNIWNAVETLRETKPVVASMADLAASGGYYISMGADRVVAQPGTLTGSIGVFGGKMNLRGLYEKLGVSLYSYKRGELADLFSSTDDFSEAGRGRFHDFLEDFYQRFLQRAADGREMSVEAMHLVAQGRVWTGSQALERGLVDDLGGLDLAIEHARELAEVDEPTGILRLPRQRTLVEELLDDLQSGNRAAAPALAARVVPGMQPTLALLESLQRVLGPKGGVAAMLPYAVEID